MLDVGEMLALEQTRARGLIAAPEHTTLGSVECLGLPIHLHGTPGSVRRSAPLLGEHTHEVLVEIGYTDEEIAKFETEGCVLAPGRET